MDGCFMKKYNNIPFFARSKSIIIIHSKKMYSTVNLKE